MRRRHSSGWCSVLAATQLWACLPDDTRATPGSVVVTASAQETLGNEGFVTSDGWRVSYRRFVIVAGELELDGDACETYSESEYSRVLDLVQPGPQRLGLVYGLGQCDFAFRVSAPLWDTLPGSGIDETDLVRLRTPGSDAHAANAGVSIGVEGTAARLGVVKRFSWQFRRFIQYTECALVDGESIERGLALRGGRELAVDLAVHGDALFAATASSSAFEPFRLADDTYGNADGEVSLAELERVPWAGGPEPDGRLWATLGERVYLGLLPSVVRFRGAGECAVESSPTEPDSESGF